MIKKSQWHKQRSQETDGAVMGEIERERHRESGGSVFRTECLPWYWQQINACSRVWRVCVDINNTAKCCGEGDCLKMTLILLESIPLSCPLCSATMRYHIQTQKEGVSLQSRDKIKRRREKEINARQPGRKQEATHFLALMQPIPKVIASAWAAVPGSDRLINDWCPALTPGPTFLLPDWTRYSVVKEFHLTIHLATMKMFDRENPSPV